MRLTKMRVVTAAGVLALAGGVAALTGAGAAAAAQPARPAQAAAEGSAPQRVVKVGEVSVTGIAISGNRLFWVTQDDESGSLNYVTLNGAAVAHTLVWHLSFSTGLVAANGWLYWADQNAIGRVRPNGAQLTRRFVVPPQESGGGIAEGLATDGQHLFFSRCQNN